VLKKTKSRGRGGQSWRYGQGIKYYRGMVAINTVTKGEMGAGEYYATRLCIKISWTAMVREDVNGSK